MLITASAITVSAQKNYKDNDRKDRYHYDYKGDRKHDVNRGRYDRSEYKRQATAINRSFDDRIRSIERNPFMNRRQKERKVQELQMHRKVALKECRERLRRS